METVLVEGVMKPVLSKLFAALGREIGLGTGSREEIEFLTQQLRFIQCILSEAEHHVVATMFLEQVKDLSYDVEDFIDELTFGMERERAPTPHGHKNFINLLPKSTKIRYKLRTLRKRVIEVREELSFQMHHAHKFDTAASSTSTVSSDPGHFALLADPSGLVGVDGPRDELAKLLMEKESESAERLKVVSIVGSGGLGKTTLAKEVYSTTKGYFECRAWVSMSPNPNLKKILIDILHQVEEDPHSSVGDGERDERDLIRKIKASLQHKRYLLVLDDIWSSVTWEIIKSGFPLNNFGSRIIATTCMNSVAESCCSHWNDYIYNIKPLSEMDSKKLFLSRIFGSVDSCPQHLVDVSDKILEKCSGLPLAIIVVSSLLATKPCTTPTWENLYNSIGATLGSMEGMKNILLLSYFDLPHHLKICFLYLSVFPEDYAINRDRIVRRWIAEGFILGNLGRTLEKVGESYLDELTNRHMIQPLYGSYDGEPEAYRIHDIMLDLIRSKSIEENFVTLLYNGQLLSALHGKIRRLSIIDIKEDHYILKTMNTSHIRTLSIFGNVGPIFSFKHFTFLRLLDLEGYKDLKNRNVEEISKLIHLRYLSIRDTPISKLPKRIGNLYYLTTLDLRGTEVEELPWSVVRLQRLEYLLCDKMRFPEWIGKLTALSCLSQFDIFQNKIVAMVELGNLSELRKLVLWWSPDIESNKNERYKHIVDSLDRLIKLESLEIHGNDSSVDFFDHMRHPLPLLQRIQLNRSSYLSRITEWFGSLPRVVCVCIDIKEVKNEDLKLLSKLHSLRYLSLSSKEVPTEQLVISSNGFYALREFHLHSARADLTFEPQAMPELVELLLSLNVLPEETYDFSISIYRFMRLKKIDIRINGESAAAWQLFEAANVALRTAAEYHPNRPIVSILSLGNLNDYADKGEKGKGAEAGTNQRQ